MFRNYLFNGYRRIASELIFWVIPFGLGVFLLLRCPAAMALLMTDTLVIGYGIYSWGKNRYEWQNTKAGHLAEGAH
jgi:ubiquinol-cytochrome c reductase subunit 8